MCKAYSNIGLRDHINLNIIIKFLHAISSLLWSFSILFLNASFSNHCSLQQLPRATSGLSCLQWSEVSSSSLLLSTGEPWKCKPLLGSQLLFSLLHSLLGVSSWFGGVFPCCRDWVDSLDLEDKVGEWETEAEWGLFDRDVLFFLFAGGKLE